MGIRFVIIAVIILFLGGVIFLQVKKAKHSDGCSCGCNDDQEAKHNTTSECCCSDNQEVKHNATSECCCTEEKHAKHTKHEMQHNNHYNKTLSITGMKCEHCKKSVTKALNGVQGVSEVSVNLETNEAYILADDKVTEDVLKQAIEDSGFILTKVNEYSN